MLTFSFSLVENSEKPHEFDLGFMDVTCGSEKIKSEELSGRGQMMIFLSITTLLDGVISLRDKNEFVFAGEDSAFVFVLKKNKKNEIEVVYQKSIFCIISMSELIKAAWATSEELYSTYASKLVGSGAALEGWDYMKNKFIQTFNP